LTLFPEPSDVTFLIISSGGNTSPEKFLFKNLINSLPDKVIPQDCRSKSLNLSGNTMVKLYKVKTPYTFLP
jgi:hypothetical protein